MLEYFNALITSTCLMEDYFLYHLTAVIQLVRASFSFLTDRLSYLLTNRLRQVAFSVSLTIS